MVIIITRQIKQAARSYCLLVLSVHWYLKRIPAAEIGRDQRIAILLFFLALRKKLKVRSVISEESVCTYKIAFKINFLN